MKTFEKKTKSNLNFCSLRQLTEHRLCDPNLWIKKIRKKKLKFYHKIKCNSTFSNIDYIVKNKLILIWMLWHKISINLKCKVSTCLFHYIELICRQIWFSSTSLFQHHCIEWVGDAPLLSTVNFLITITFLCRFT